MLVLCRDDWRRSGKMLLEQEISLEEPGSSDLCLVPGKSAKEVESMTGHSREELSRGDLENL